jgi:proline racemase
MRLKTIDGHIAGTPLRLIVEGFPAAAGSTMAEKREWAEARTSDLRCGVLCEPRGHRDLTGAVFTEPIDDASDAGILFMDAGGYRPFSALGAMTAVALAARRCLIVPRDQAAIAVDTVAGPVRAHLSSSGDDGDDAAGGIDVTLDSLPAFVIHAGLVVTAAGRRLRADVAASGECYAVVDAESAGVPLDVAHLAEVRSVGRAIAEAVNSAVRFVHPFTGASSVAGTVLTSPAHRDNAALRHVLVTGAGTVGRGPSGSGSGAILAVLDAMGLPVDEEAVECEGLTGLTLSAAVRGRRQVGDYAAVDIRLRGRVFVTGDHSFVFAPDDPLRSGLAI